jgi:hypothetical protein
LTRTSLLCSFRLCGRRSKLKCNNIKRSAHIVWDLEKTSFVSDSCVVQIGQALELDQASPRQVSRRDQALRKPESFKKGRTSLAGPPKSMEPPLTQGSLVLDANVYLDDLRVPRSAVSFVCSGYVDSVSGIRSVYKRLYLESERRRAVSQHRAAKKKMQEFAPPRKISIVRGAPQSKSEALGEKMYLRERERQQAREAKQLEELEQRKVIDTARAETR